MANWQAINYDQSIPDLKQPFSIICPKETDLWDKPPSTHRSNAPGIYTSTTVGAFKSATVSVKGDWKYRYDQGGFCLLIDLKDGTRKWMKAGIEFLDGNPLFSVVTKDRWADWSLRPLLNAESKSAKIQIEPHDDGALWVFLLGPNNEKHPVREVTWWGELESDTKIQIGPAAAKPSQEGDELIVEFSDLEVVTV